MEFIWKCCIYSTDKDFNHGGIYICIDSIDGICKTEYLENLHCDKSSSHKETDVDCLAMGICSFFTVRGWTKLLEDLQWHQNQGFTWLEIYKGRPNMSLLWPNSAKIGVFVKLSIDLNCSNCENTMIYSRWNISLRWLIYSANLDGEKS